MSRPPTRTLATRGSLGGVLMGLANLVPGISGGTMLLAAGVYRGFIEGVAEVTTFRFRGRTLILLGSIGASALLALLLLAGPVNWLVASHRWLMYSLFLGLTLGGVPVVWRMVKQPGRAFVVGAAAGFAVMALMAATGPDGNAGSGSVLLAVAGMAAASAMVLPGISGAYLFLVLGQYQRILGAIDSVKHGNFSEAWPVLLPVAVGIAVGVAAISNLVRWTLRHHENATLGVLMGLLFGSVLGIYPFQEGVGRQLVRFTPAAWQVAVSLALVGAGLALTWLIEKVGRNPERA